MMLLQLKLEKGAKEMKAQEYLFVDVDKLTNIKPKKEAGDIAHQVLALFSQPASSLHMEHLRALITDKERGIGMKVSGSIYRVDLGSLRREYGRGNTKPLDALVEFKVKYEQWIKLLKKASPDGFI